MMSMQRGDFATIVLVLAVVGGVAGIDKALLGTKTAYDWVRTAAEPATNADMVLESGGRTCTAIHVNMVLRHGSRNPGADDLEDIVKLVQKIRDNKNGSAGALDFIDTWKSDLKAEDGDMLNNVGIKEMNDIGARTAKRFNTLLTAANRNRLEFISSTRQRCIDSGKQFSRGLYGTTEMATPTQNNMLMRILDNCEYYDTVLDDNEDIIMEQQSDFMESSTYTDMVDGIESRLKFKPGANFTADDMEYIWEMCAFELMAGHDNTWCLLMTDNDRKIAAFAKDLEDFYEDSYGTEVVDEGSFANGLSGEVHCVLVKKLVALMDDAMAKHKAGTADYKVGSFMFGHSATIMGLLTALNLFKDDPLLDASDLNRNRKFVASEITPMAGNLGFALYACPNQDGADVNYAVKLFHNEEGMAIPPNIAQAIPYDQFRLRFKDAANCDIDAICKYPRDTSGATAIGASGFVLLLVSCVNIFLGIL